MMLEKGNSDSTAHKELRQVPKYRMLLSTSNSSKVQEPGKMEFRLVHVTIPY